MGVTIHYVLGAWDYDALVRTLEQAGEIAKRMGMEVVAEDPAHLRLIVNPSEDCETLAFEFRTWGEIKGSEGWSYAKSMIGSTFKLGAERYGEELKNNPHLWKDIQELEEGWDRLYLCADFCKTQFAGDITHQRVAELIRFVASRCSLVYIDMLQGLGWNVAKGYEIRGR